MCALCPNRKASAAVFAKFSSSLTIETAFSIHRDHGGTGKHRWVWANGLRAFLLHWRHEPYSADGACRSRLTMRGDAENADQSGPCHCQFYAGCLRPYRKCVSSPRIGLQDFVWRRRRGSEPFLFRRRAAGSTQWSAVQAVKFHAMSTLRFKWIDMR